MVNRTFYFKGRKNSSVIDVGLRPSAIYYGNGVFNLKIVAHNMPGKTKADDKVEVIVSGDKDVIQRFYDYVKENDIRQIKKDVKPGVTKLKEYAGKEPDWDYCLNATNTEQIFKGFDAIKGMGSSLENININFERVIEKYGTFGKDMNEMKESMKKLESLVEMKDAFISFLDDAKKK